MTYTQATILEAHRRSQIIPIAIGHKVVSDFEYRGYLFKAVSKKETNSMKHDMQVLHWYKLHNLISEGNASICKYIRCLNERGYMARSNSIQSNEIHRFEWKYR